MELTEIGQDFDRASKAFKVWYGITVEHKEHALRGWNWGKAEFGRAELAFNVQNRPAFEIPYSEIANTNQAGKNEIAVEFNLEGEPKTNGANGEKAGHTKNRGRKAAAARDELVEMRFYIPGKVSKKDVDGEEPGSDADDDDVEEQDAAKAFYETLMDKAEIGEVAGQTFATFLDILHLTPRYVAVNWVKKDILTLEQRTIRHRHVRRIIPITRQNLRLQSAVPIDQEILHPPQKRRYPHPPCSRPRSPSTTGPNPLRLRCHAAQKRRRSQPRPQHDRRAPPLQVRRQA